MKINVYSHIRQYIEEGADERLQSLRKDFPNDVWLIKDVIAAVAEELCDDIKDEYMG